jgi:sterol desaturase/sphingolipid hydroxylase (fatty acid hydroxylase superfamily)
MNLLDFAWATDIAGQWLLNMQTDIVRYVVFSIGVWLALWVLLAPLLRGRKIRDDTPPAKQLGLEFLISIRSIAIFSTIGLFTFLLERAGLLPGPAIASAWGPAWFWASLALMIVAHDAFFYWSHRLMHDPRLFRRFHRRHHKSHNPSPFTAYSFDLGEAAVMAAFVPLWMIIVPTAWPVVGIFMLHQIVRNTLGHSGYELMPARADGKPMFDWLTTTTHHDLHHAQAGWNYGLYFTWWDRLMGTEHPEYQARFAAAVRKPMKQSAAAALPVSIAAGLAVALCALAIPQAARAQTAPNIHDDWATPGLGAVVRLEQCANDTRTLCGRITWAWDPNELRHGGVGVMIVRDFRWDGRAWTGGAVFNPEDGRTYSGSIRLDNALLRLRGCAGPFCREQTWRRLADIPRPRSG